MCKILSNSVNPVYFRRGKVVAIDKAKLDQLIQKGLVDAGATLSAALIVVGDKLGLYKAMAGRAGIAERYAREWLAGQAAGGYVDYDPQTGRYSLSEEQAYLMADENS